MFDAICATIFVLVVGFAFIYFYAVLTDAFWNSKWARKIRKEAAEVIINSISTGKELRKMLDEIKSELNEIV